MSRAVKCDCCGKCFDRFNKDGAHIHIPEIFVFDCSQTNPKKNEAAKFKRHYEDIDLCPECSERFETLFTVKE